jgi:hypothetical protein
MSRRLDLIDAGSALTLDVDGLTGGFSVKAIAV